MREKARFLTIPYTVSGKTYDVVRNTYLHVSICNNLASTVYYFPLAPSWSVVDNSMPEGKFWNNFLHSSKAILVLLIFYFVVSAFLLRKDYSFRSMCSAVQQDKRAYTFMMAIFYPFLVMALFSLFSVLELFYESNVAREYYLVFRYFAAIAFLGILVLPSAILLRSYFKKCGKLKDVFSFIVIFAMFYLHIMLRGQLPMLFMFVSKSAFFQSL